MTAFVQRFANWIGWGALGVTVGLVGVFLAIDFKMTKVRMLELGDTNLVDVKNPLNDLQVLYNGKDLLKENLGLHFYRIQVQNTENTIILKEYFANDDS